MQAAAPFGSKGAGFDFLSSSRQSQTQVGYPAANKQLRIPLTIRNHMV
jgi:hypothetical protein